MMIPSTSGIYVIRCSAEAKLYVGSALNLNLRWQLHLTDLRAGKHHSFKLQRAFHRFGELAFRMEVLQECRPEQLISLEQAALDELHAVDTGYNVCRVAGSRLGMRHTDASRALMSQKARQRPPVTDETRRKQSAASKGKPKSELTKQRMAAAAKKRPPRSLETIEKHRQALTGRSGLPHTEAHKEHMREVMTGRSVSAETRQKIKESWDRRRAQWGPSGSPT